MTDFDPGPLRPPAPPNVEAARSAQKLRGHSTSDRWLPEGLWRELDELRSEQLRVREQVGAELAALEAARARFAEDDKRQDEQLRQAVREGDSPPKDKRTPA
jgi:hypothetical protein